LKLFAVIGLGRFGSSVAKTLSAMGYEVMAVDNDEMRVQEISHVVTHAVQADATDEDAMRALGVRNADCAVVSIGQNIQASILSTLLLKGLGVPYVAAKAQNELHGRVLDKVGADRVIYPERDMGVRVARNLVSSNLLDYLELSPDYSILETVASQRVVGKTLGELNLRARHGISIIAIRRGSDINLSPGADDVILEDDTLVMMGRIDQLDKLQKP
jgi:trk system potassium uptake protein TrkA